MTPEAPTPRLTREQILEEIEDIKNEGENQGMSQSLRAFRFSLCNMALSSLTRPTLAPALQALELRRALEEAQTKLRSLEFRNHPHMRGMEVADAIHRALTLPLSAAELKVKAMQEAIKNSIAFRKQVGEIMGLWQEDPSPQHLSLESLRHEIFMLETYDERLEISLKALSALTEGEVKL